MQNPIAKLLIAQFEEHTPRPGWLFIGHVTNAMGHPVEAFINLKTRSITIGTAPQEFFIDILSNIPKTYSITKALEFLLELEKCKAQLPDCLQPKS